MAVVLFSTRAEVKRDVRRSSLGVKIHATAHACCRSREDILPHQRTYLACMQSLGCISCPYLPYDSLSGVQDRLVCAHWRCVGCEKSTVAAIKCMIAAREVQLYCWWVFGRYVEGASATGDLIGALPRSLSVVADLRPCRKRWRLIPKGSRSRRKLQDAQT